MSIRYRYIVWNNVRKFQENPTNSFWTMRLNVGMGMEIAGMWYLSNNFISSFYHFPFINMKESQEQYPFSNQIPHIFYLKWFFYDRY